MNLNDAKIILEIKEKVDIMWDYFTEQEDKKSEINNQDIQNG